MRAYILRRTSVAGRRMGGGPHFRRSGGGQEEAGVVMMRRAAAVFSLVALAVYSGRASAWAPSPRNHARQRLWTSFMPVPAPARRCTTGARPIETSARGRAPLPYERVLGRVRPLHVLQRDPRVSEPSQSVRRGMYEPGMPMQRLPDFSAGLATTVSSLELPRPQLPALTSEDEALLRNGGRVQKQTRQGGAGMGHAVVDVRADQDTIMALLTAYEQYSEIIDTVRSASVVSRRKGAAGAESVTCEFTMSRFRLHVRVVMTQPAGRSDTINFELDPECTGAGKNVLKEAKGLWFVEPTPGRLGYTRVWLSARVQVSAFVPGFIVDYAASRALPRASIWIKPTCERSQRRNDRAQALLSRAAVAATLANPVAASVDPA